MGFDSDGIISALECKVWCLGGAFLDISFSDIAGIMSGLNQVGLEFIRLLNPSRAS